MTFCQKMHDDHWEEVSISRLFFTGKELGES